MDGFRHGTQIHVLYHQKTFAECLLLTKDIRPKKTITHKPHFYSHSTETEEEKKESFILFMCVVPLSGPSTGDFLMTVLPFSSS